MKKRGSAERGTLFFYAEIYKVLRSISILQICFFTALSFEGRRLQANIFVKPLLKKEWDNVKIKLSNNKKGLV